jgi:UDP-4-amino-4,6-dideoxy-N-acetyl-beta-L-altrosamine transaminase
MDCCKSEKNWANLVMIPYSRQDITQDDIDAVVAVLKSEFLTQGPLVPQFEKAVADYCGSQFSVAVNSATSALHIACLSLGLGPGEIAWTSPNSFMASANCALYCGATVDFVDIDPLTYNMSAATLEEKLQEAKKLNKLPKVVIPVHFAGQSCEMKRIHALSKEYGFRIIEDASHAVGGRYLNKPIGNCEYSDVAVFSFHPVKIITTAEGGMAVTNDGELAKKMRLFRSHGTSSDPKDMEPRPTDEIWNYQQIELGYNYRMTDLQAALGLSQIKRLDHYVAKRHVLAKRYDNLLSEMNVIVPHQDIDSYSAYHLYPIQVRAEDKAKARKNIYEGFLCKDIRVTIHYSPIHLQPFYARRGFSVGDFKNAENYFAGTLSIPLYPNLAEPDQNFIIQTMQSLLI